MIQYYAAVVCAIIISTIIVIFIQYKLKKLKLKACLAIAAASLISASAMPAAYHVITMAGGGAEGSLQLIATIGAIGASLLLGLIFSIIISGSIASDKNKTAIQADDKTEAVQAEEAATADVSEEVQDNYIEQIYNIMSDKNSSETENYGENSAEEADNTEISVDMSGNTDKISIDNYMQDSEKLTLDDCINMAFDFRDKGELEAAAQYFMYALDRKPDKDLTFWIVLDICVLYKSLGQRKLAEEILNSYYDSFGDIMDESVKEEILLNINEIG